MHQHWETRFNMWIQNNGSHTEHIMLIKFVKYIRMFISPMYGNLWPTLYCVLLDV